MRGISSPNQRTMDVVEWTINNFSYWNVNVHEKVIECSGSGFENCPRILLYPRGLNGCDEHLLVHIYGRPDVSKVLSGHVSCTDSNGSLFCTLEFDEKMRNGDYYELLPLLKFTEVAAQIRNIKIPHQDRFTLRCELRSDHDRAYRMYTTIDVFDSSVKIDPTKIKDGEMCNISTIQYYFDESEKDAMYLFVTKKKTIFCLEQNLFEKNIFVSTSLSVLKFDSVIRTEENEHVFQDDESWKFSDSLTREELTEEGFSLLLRIKITPTNKYKCRYGYYTGYKNAVDLLPTKIFTLSESLKASTSNKPDDSVTVLLNELTRLYQDHDISDFQLRCGEVSIPTHKSILSAQSPVFKAMLLSNMREAASDSMDIADLDVHTLGRFLVFLYTGTVDDLEWEDALKLYYAADKYQVPSLKGKCFSVFHENVSVSNVCDILSLADRHHDEELTKEAHDFILKNYNDVLRSEEWETFLMTEPLLAVKTVTYFAKKNIFRVISDS